MLMVKFLILLALLFGGCAMKQAELSPQKKAFASEDAYVLFALDAEMNGQYKAASQLYAALYEKAPRPVYRDHFFANLLRAKAYDEVLENVRQQKTGFDPELERYKIRALIGKKDIVAAQTTALVLLERTKAKQDYVAAAEIYAMQKQFNTALRYLQSAYAIDYDEQVLDKMAVMMYVHLERKKDAIAQLETHIRLNGCSERICKRLAGFYSDQNNIEGMLSTYLRLYDTAPSPDVAATIVRIYSYQNDVVHLKQFLEQYHTDDALLLKLYINAKEYAAAAALAGKLYDDTGDAQYLGQQAIMTFEAAPNPHDPAMLTDVVTKLKQAVKSREEALMLNYLGYLLIDYGFDPAAGIDYVKRALKQEPDSPFYLDSLAWGYYKLGECEKAEEVMQSVVKAMNGERDDEVDKHLDAIKACVKRMHERQKGDQ